MSLVRCAASAGVWSSHTQLSTGGWLTSGTSADRPISWSVRPQPTKRRNSCRRSTNVCSRTGRSWIFESEGNGTRTRARRGRRRIRSPMSLGKGRPRGLPHPMSTRPRGESEGPSGQFRQMGSTRQGRGTYRPFIYLTSTPHIAPAKSSHLNAVLGSSSLKDEAKTSSMYVE